MTSLLKNPASAFLMVLAVSYLAALFFSRLSWRGKDVSAAGKKPYACGEDSYDHQANPDYSSFFPFAFFFTLAHVACMIITILPKADHGAFVLAAVFILATLAGLRILLKG